KLGPDQSRSQHSTSNLPTRWQNPLIPSGDKAPCEIPAPQTSALTFGAALRLARKSGQAPLNSAEADPMRVALRGDSHTVNITPATNITAPSKAAMQNATPAS